MPKKLIKNCKAVKKDKKLKEGYLGQTLQDFLDVCIDEYIIDKIYVYGTDDIVYEGPMYDLPDDMRDAEFLEFEAYSNGRDMVTINVDSTEEYGLDTYYTTLEDFLDDCNNDNIVIFDLGSEEEIFRGDKYDIPDEVKDLIFVSFDSPNALSVNLSDYEGDSDDYDEDEDDEDFDESLDDTQKLIDNAKKFAKENNKDVKVKGLVNSNECVIDTFPEDFNEMVELFSTKFDVYDKDDEFERFKIRVKSANENLEESSIPVKDLLVKTDNKYDITLDHAIDDIKKKKGNPHDSLLGDEGAISTLMKRFGLEKRDVIRALNYKFDGKVLDESVEDDMEKLPHVVMAFKDGGVHRLELEWRPSTRKAHSDYVDLSQAIKNKFGDADIKVKKQEWRDGNKETRYVLEVTLKDNAIKEDVNQLAKKMGAKLLPPKDYGVKKKRPRYVYEVYYFDTEDCRGDAIYRKFSSRKAQEEWYEKHKDDPDKFGMYAFDDATVYENLNEAYNTEDRIKELKEIKKTRALTDDELEELAYCENEVSSREAERNYLNGESLNEAKEEFVHFDFLGDIAKDEVEDLIATGNKEYSSKEDKPIWDSLTDEEKCLLVLDSDMGFHFDNTMENEEITNKVNEIQAKFPRYNKKLTEAPDDLGFLTDEEIEEQERQEFEKKLAQRKAARDNAKKAEQDRIAQEQAKEKAKQDAIAKGKELYNKVKDLPFEDWFEYLVPSSGKASTVAGELVRAINRVIYRDWNDGDLFYQGYGRETCGAPAVYILYNVEDASSTLYDLVGKEDEAYTEGIERVGEIIHKYLLDNPDLFGQENEDDCLDSKKFDVDVEFEEPRDYEYTIHLEDYINDDLDICLADFVNNGDVDAFEVVDRIEEDANAECNTYDEIHCETPWSYSTTEYTIIDLTKDQYDTLRNHMEHSSYFDYYIEELYKEYGDPNDPQRDEVDESVNKNWDTIEFNYDKLPITRLNPDTLVREPMEINYTHKVSQDDVEDALFNILEDRGELDDLSLEAGVNYVMNNFDELVNKYEDELKELFRSGAITTAENGGLQEGCHSKKKRTLKEGYIGQTLEDLFYDCVDPEVIGTVSIWGDDDEIYNGDYEGAIDEYGNNQFIEFDCGMDKVVINVDTSEEYQVTDYIVDVQDFIDFFNGNEIEVYDINTGETLFSGDKNDLPDDVAEKIFVSFDAPKFISINIEEDSYGDDWFDQNGFIDFDESLKENNNTLKLQNGGFAYISDYNKDQFEKEYVETGKYKKSGEAQSPKGKYTLYTNSVGDTYAVLDENLEEDTVKQGGKWVNKGNTGETHGEFKTKEEADKQRKAMFVNKKPNTKWGK